MTYREAKNEIREFLRARPDWELCKLLDRARAGHLKYHSCAVCLVGAIFGHTAAVDAANGRTRLTPVDNAYRDFSYPVLIEEAGSFDAAYDLERLSTKPETEALRQRRLIPLLLSEISRRGAEAARRTHYPEAVSSNLTAATNSHEAR